MTPSFNRSLFSYCLCELSNHLSRISAEKSLCNFVLNSPCISLSLGLTWNILRTASNSSYLQSINMTVNHEIDFVPHWLKTFQCFPIITLVWHQSSSRSGPIPHLQSYIISTKLYYTHFLLPHWNFCFLWDKAFILYMYMFWHK